LTTPGWRSNAKGAEVLLGTGRRASFLASQGIDELEYAVTENQEWSSSYMTNSD
jgi:hypothetical protein